MELVATVAATWFGVSLVAGVVLGRGMRARFAPVRPTPAAEPVRLAHPTALAS